ncbi:MAG: hypothetical protein HZB39_03760 [Planctomycetes bacterium]|nr:hypothetical protein [Planctomycetota bacterium]
MSALLRTASVVVVLLLTALASCSFYSTAVDWNGRVGPNGRPVHYRSGTRVGFNLFVVLPFVGRTDVNEMVDRMSATVAEEKGDVVRIVQADSENYWYGWSPLTWIITPVVTSIDVEFEPSTEALAAAERERQAQSARDQRQVQPLDLPPATPPDRQRPAHRDGE